MWAFFFRLLVGGFYLALGAWRASFQFLKKKKQEGTELEGAPRFSGYVECFNGGRVGGGGCVSTSSERPRRTDDLLQSIRVRSTAVDPRRLVLSPVLFFSDTYLVHVRIRTRMGGVVPRSTRPILVPPVPSFFLRKIEK